MKTSTRRALENSKRSVEETHAVHTALLVNPSEVYELTYSYQKELRTTLRGCWTLDGIVSDTRFEELRANIGKKVMHEITATTTLAGAAYAVISSQLGNWQHRFLLPLYESKAIEMFAGASKEPLSLHFSSAGEDQGSIFYRRVFSADDYMLVSAVGRASVLENSAAFVRELPLVISDMLNPGQVPSSSMTEVVREVEVSVLMPRSVMASHILDERLEAVW